METTPIDALTKRCSQCGVAQSVEQFSWNGKWRAGQCKACRAAYYKQWREEKRAYKRAYDKAYYDANRGTILAGRAVYREQNATVLKERDREFRRLHAEKIAADKREYRKRNRKRLAAKDRRYRQENPELLRASARAHYERVRKTPEAQKRYRLAVARRRARILGAFVEDVAREVVFERDAGLCGICGAPVDAEDWHLDHVVPLALGGTHEYSNVQVAHPRCNMSKGARAA